MRSLWSDREAAAYAGDLAQRVYTSRLLGRDPTLVLHGGGNTSVKGVERTLFGDDERILYVKGSGFDLAKVCAEVFAAQAGPNTIGVVLMNHGLFTFGETARESYERMITLVTRA